MKIAVPENEIGKLKKGMKASFQVSALENQLFEGVVTNVGVVANQVSRTYEVKILVKNTNLLLKPGMVCDVKLDLAVKRQAMAVPYQSVDKDKDNNSYVFVVDANDAQTARKRIVSVGNYQGDNVEVLSGLTVGEKVVCEGKEKLSDNCKISF